MVKTPSAMFIFLVAVGGGGGSGGGGGGGGGGGKQARRREGSLQKRSFYGHKMGPKSWCDFIRVRPR